MDVAKLVHAIRTKAKEESPLDDPSVYLDDIHGGNYDDAFFEGSKHGQIWFARELLKIVDSEEPPKSSTTSNTTP